MDLLSFLQNAQNPHQVASYMDTDDESSNFDSEQENQLPSSLAPHRESHKMSASRRAAHVKSEKKRRRNLNNGFEELREVVPLCTYLDSKAGILRKATDYVRMLTDKMDPSRFKVYLDSVPPKEDTLKSRFAQKP